VARPPSRRSLATVRNRPRRSPNFVKLAIQLSLDPDVTWLEFVEILPLPKYNLHATVEMIVADRSDGRIAFDIVDERSTPDVDADGLLMLALENYQIRLVEMNDKTINKEPIASNALRVWEHRGDRVERGVVAAIDRAFVGRQSISVGKLGMLVGLSEPLPIVSALMCRGVLEADLSTKTFGSNSLVARRWRYPGATPTCFIRRLDNSHRKTP
jgi:hypothetical protein